MGSEIIWKYEKPNYEILLEKLEKLQKENEESKELYDKLFNGYNKLVQEHLELEKENEELKKDLAFYKEIAMKGGQ